jgi:transcriptional antiterminator
MSGRPKAATKAEVLQVIHETVTVSASELAKSLNVDRATVYRRLKEINPEEIDQALGVNEKSKLTPAEKEFRVFFTIPKVKELSSMNPYYTSRSAQRNIQAEWFMACTGSAFGQESTQQPWSTATSKS